MNLWPHQIQGPIDARRAEAEGARCICICTPTGGGKRTMIVGAAKETVAEGGRAVILTNRRIITRQTSKDLDGLDYGIVAAGYPAAMGEGILLASVQTLHRRGGTVNLPSATRVFVDEAHSKLFHPIAQAYRDKGVPVWMFTATPVGLGKVADRLVIAGSNSSLRACGALVPCRVYSPEHPQIKGVRRTKSGEFYQPQLRKMFAQYQTDVFGNVLEWYRQLNPFGTATLLWAPGVPESRWFVEEFERNGITAAHIDGETSEEDRERIMDGSKDGSIKIVCSYGVLREGADMPWIRHGILVQVCGAISTYLQIVGRLLRASAHKTECVLQDHSGAMWRHGSPNSDREWTLGDTDVSLAKKAQKERAEGKNPEPIRCPQCGGERLRGPKCPHCGYQHEKSSRMVRMVTGKLVTVTGDLVKKLKADDGMKLWMSCLYAAGHRGRTMNQARGDYHRRSKGWPRPEWKFVPAYGSLDWQREVTKVYPFLFRKKANA